ncbi:Clp1/GlmU family protein [Thermococcus atlanticus]
MNKAKYTDDVPGDRRELLKIIGQLDRPAKIMVIGGTDSGKTTLVTFLANRLVSTGFRVALVDSDVGQKSLLPPATVSLALAELPFESPSELRALKHYFVGSITPDAHFGEVIAGVKRLAEIGERLAHFVIIDTTGYVENAGEDLKRLKAELLRPELAVLLQKENELEELGRSLERFSRVIFLEVSEKALEHSRSERRNIRKEKWRRYFENAQEYTADLTEYILSGTRMFHGEEIKGEERELLEKLHGWLIFAGWRNRGYTVVKAGDSCRGVDRRLIHCIDIENLSNLLVGFIDKDGLCIGLGILKLINFREKKAEILTPLRQEELGKAVEIRFGRIRVREDGEELGLLRRNAL